MKRIPIIILLLTLLVSCNKKANIQEVYEEGNYVFATANSCHFENNNIFPPEQEGKMGVPYLWSYDKAAEKVVFHLKDGSRCEFDSVKYNSTLSDDVQLCLENNDLKFKIENAGKLYKITIYKDTGNFSKKWALIATMENCQVNCHEDRATPTKKNIPLWPFAAGIVLIIIIYCIAKVMKSRREY